MSDITNTNNPCVIIKSCGENTCSGMDILDTIGPYTHDEAHAILIKGSKICGEYKSHPRGYHSWHMGDYNETVYTIYELTKDEDKIFSDARYEADEFPQDEYEGDDLRVH